MVKQHIAGYDYFSTKAAITHKNELEVLDGTNMIGKNMPEILVKKCSGDKDVK